MTYDRIGIGYDTTRRADPRIAATLRRLLEPRTNGRILDVACGTGNYTSALSDSGVDITGIDQSGTMLAAARAKHLGINWKQADVTALPFVDASFAGAICTLAIHHFTDLGGALCEIARVMASGGRLVIFTATAEQMQRYWLNTYFPAALEAATRQMPQESAILAALAAAHLTVEAIEPWSIPPDPVDLFLYAGKHNPGLYLDPEVRRGISTFANFAEADEIAAGIARLEADIASGAIEAIKKSYDSDCGDYTFIAARKQ